MKCFAHCLALVLTAAAGTAAAQEPALILIDGSALGPPGHAFRPKIPPSSPRPGNSMPTPCALETPLVSVMDKQKLPPSGDKHDFVSYGPYWWPDPKKPDGLPYIRRDGEVNPESRGPATDYHAMGRMADAVKTLALAYFLSHDEAYAAHAARLLRAWFLDPATRMNPNLNFGQAIPGVCEGRGVGIIDTVSLLPIPDATLVLLPSAAWTDADQQGLRDWFAAYLQWLLTSKNGKDEAAAENNHGTWYDAQVAALAIYVGRPEIARQTLQTAQTTRIAPDRARRPPAAGAGPHQVVQLQPHERERDADAGGAGAAPGSTCSGIKPTTAARSAARSTTCCPMPTPRTNGRINRSAATAPMTFTPQYCGRPSCMTIPGCSSLPSGCVPRSRRQTVCGCK